MRMRWSLLVALVLAQALTAGCAYTAQDEIQKLTIALHEKSAAAPPAPAAGVGEILAAASKTEPAEEHMENLSVGDVGQPVAARMLVRDAGLVIGVAKPEDGVRQALEIARSLGGYAQTSTLDSAVLRVPAAKFDAALEGLARLGTVVERKVEVRDVTEEYTDLDLRLKGKQALLARLQELMKKADKVEDMLKFEVEISRLTTEIEQLEGKLRLLKNQVLLSCIAVRFDSSTAVASQKAGVRLPFWWLQQVGLDHILSSH